VPSRLAGKESRAARKIAARKGNAAQVLNKDDQTNEVERHSESKEIVAASEERPSDVQVIERCQKVMEHDAYFYLSVDAVSFLQTVLLSFLGI